jgi:transcriptional regulator with XRE-family HTH domain
MPSRERAVDVGAARGRAASAELLRELHATRVDRGLSGATIARAVGISEAQYSRIERGVSGDLAIIQATRLLAAVGLKLSIRAFPDGEPLRDAAHARLLERLRVGLHRSLRFRTEVGFPAPNDRRAWDAVISTASWTMGVEAETRPRDRQALERRLELKLRDGAVDYVALLLLDTRHNRDFVRVHRAVLVERLPVPGLRALELLHAGVDPGGSTLIML